MWGGQILAAAALLGGSPGCHHKDAHPRSVSLLWIYLITTPWIIFVAYWIISALKTNKTVRQESPASRFIILTLEIAGFVLLFDANTSIGPLGHHVVPPSDALAAMGVLCTWTGIALAIWARRHLGQYWSGRITLKEGHQLIRTGPYAHFRHPIYSGLDLAAVGGALAIDEWRCVLGVALIVLGYWIKAKREEALLTTQFGPAFAEHCRHTGFLIPRF